jgi:formate--tetrahydrofolate ligase
MSQAMPSSLQIAQATQPKHITKIGADLGLTREELEPYGPYVAKIDLARLMTRLGSREDGRLVVVTGITPTPLGEGKTTTLIGLVQGLGKIGVKSAATLRQPTLGPIFGIKGGANGGGYSQIIPMEQFNLHMTGDSHAVGAAHNLAAAFVDNHLHHGNALGIDPYSIDWPRVVEMSDRALRDVVLGLGGKEGGVPRQSEFHITSASEIMAVLALSRDLKDLRARIGRIVVGLTKDKEKRPVTLEDLKVAGAMTALLRESVKPNLMQTMEGQPAFIHAGPFGNIAQGNNSVIADRVALKLADIVCTEAGFGADLGCEKFFNIKCRQGGLRPSAAVLVGTIRALKMHGGLGKIVAGKPLDPALQSEDVAATKRGAANLVKQLENVLRHGVPCVVAINSFPTDTPAEVAAVQELALAAGAKACVVSRHFSDGGAGAAELAKAVWETAKPNVGGAPEFRLLYPDDAPLAKKIETIAVEIYGADGVEIAPAAMKQLTEFEKQGHGKLPICMAKTHLSLSHDPAKLGRPSGFKVPVRGARLCAGAGFITVLAGDMRLMPGLPSKPAGEGIDVDEHGNITGLY